MKKPRNEFHEAAIKGLKCARKLVSDFELLVGTVGLDVIPDVVQGDHHTHRQKLTLQF